MKSDEELKQTFKVFVDQGSILEGIILKEVRGSVDNTRRLELIEEVVLENLHELKLKLQIECL